jgi:hypothetical protein
MPRYVLLLHQAPADYAAVTQAQMTDLITRYSAWSRDLREKGVVKDGFKLTNDGGRHLARSGKAITATDGPYSEAKEVLGGLFVIEATDDAAAEAVAQTCPHLHAMPHSRVELRRIHEV